MLVVKQAHRQPCHSKSLPPRRQSSRHRWLSSAARGSGSGTRTLGHHILYSAAHATAIHPVSGIPQVGLSPQQAESTSNTGNADQHKRAVQHRRRLTFTTVSVGHRRWRPGAQQSAGSATATAQQGQHNHGANTHKAENRFAHRHRRNAGRITVVDINIAAVSTLLDNAVVDGAICRHQSSCQKGKAQGVQCRIPVS